ncbi:hypothetical protein F5Y16DRAFT_160851 [Xylariaceae sp. FL0255]|nr:hypothetical protein F5Y16DRAFT_160851 [Xylariaceae sp. FL0255]
MKLPVVARNTYLIQHPVIPVYCVSRASPEDKAVTTKRSDHPERRSFTACETVNHVCYMKRAAGVMLPAFRYRPLQITAHHTVYHRHYSVISNGTGRVWPLCPFRCSLSPLCTAGAPVGSSRFAEALPHSGDPATAPANDMRLLRAHHQIPLPPSSSSTSSANSHSMAVTGPQDGEFWVGKELEHLGSITFDSAFSKAPNLANGSLDGPFQLVILSSTVNDTVTYTYIYIDGASLRCTKSANCQYNLRVCTTSLFSLSPSIGVGTCLACQRSTAKEAQPPPASIACTHVGGIVHNRLFSSVRPLLDKYPAETTRTVDRLRGS